MCLYPKLIKNRRYVPNKKNGGVPPQCPDERLRYQDLIQEQMVGETSVYENGETIDKIKHLAANKTVAWIDYMTNYNRTFGDFAAGEALDFMVLNRRYEVSEDNTIEDLTTYIDPQKYIEIFADTAIDSQNFWIQTVVQATRRGNYSAKQIPFL